MSSINVWVYLRSQRKPVPVANVTRIDLRPAVGVQTGDTYRNLFEPGVMTLVDPISSNNQMVGGGHLLPGVYDGEATGRRLLTVADNYAGRAPQPLATQRDQLTFTTDPDVSGSDKIWAWSDEVLMIGTCDPNNIPDTGVTYVWLKGRRTPVPLVHVTAIEGYPVAVNWGETYRNILPTGIYTVLEAISLKSTFIGPNIPLPAIWDTSNDGDGNLVAISDDRAARAPAALSSLADITVFSISDSWLVGDRGLHGWRSEILMVSNAKP